MIKLDNDWDEIVGGEQQKPYYQNLRKFLKEEYASQIVYPPMGEIFSALRHVPYAAAKVVILGQDPYIKQGEAHGMAFSVMPAAKIPPSLKNIFKELNVDLGCAIPNNGYLMPWASQGVLLLNTVLTVRAGQSKSHANKGWEHFTSHIMQALNGRPQPLIFMLWGNDAKSKAGLITAPHHKILTAAHPSPLAGGKFFGCKHFSQANEFLLENNRTPINWQIPNL